MTNASSRKPHLWPHSRWFSDDTRLGCDVLLPDDKNHAGCRKVVIFEFPGGKNHTSYRKVAAHYLRMKRIMLAIEMLWYLIYEWKESYIIIGYIQSRVSNTPERWPHSLPRTLESRAREIQRDEREQQVQQKAPVTAVPACQYDGSAEQFKKILNRPAKATGAWEWACKSSARA